MLSSVPEHLLTALFARVYVCVLDVKILSRSLRMHMQLFHMACKSACSVCVCAMERVGGRARAIICPS